MKSTGCNASKCYSRKRFNEETMKVMEWRVRWAVEARRKGRGEEQEQRRQQEQEQWRQDEHEQREQQ